MNMKDYGAALKIAQKAEYDSVEELMPLKDGTSVFRPILDGAEDDGCTGIPFVIFVRNGEARFSDPSEAIEYNYLLYKKTNGK